jgi:integrase
VKRALAATKKANFGVAAYVIAVNGSIRLPLRFRLARSGISSNQGSLPGLRKSMAKRLAEAGAMDAKGMAILGHTKAETFARYRAKANRV